MCYLYHYTSADGFSGIIESQELWATSVYHLNDWTEFEHGRDAFIESAKVLLKDEKVVDAAVQLLSYLHDQHPPLFVCSFSAAKDGDDLTQWRAYSSGGGCAIGFPTAQLLNEAEMQRFDLLQCQYDTAGVGKTVEGTVRIMGHIIQMAGGIHGFRSQFPFNDPTKDGLLALLLKFVAKYKDEAFIAEKEWRLVHLLERGEHPRFRMSDNVQIPYVTFNLKKEALWKQAKIVLSPCLPETAERRAECVQAFLESELHKHNLPRDCARAVRLSRVPYRANIDKANR